MIDDATRYCREVLPGVSRTFALGIELLNDPLRDEIGVAYLICRILDTIEDTTGLPPADRAALLDRASVALTDPGVWEDCAASVESMFADTRLDGRDHDLCRGATIVLSAFHRFRSEARDAMRKPIREMGEGMAATVRRELRSEGLRIETMEDLERYCYYVAGTVGHLLTNLFALDRPSIDAGRENHLRERAVPFGLGLQVTNIIKGITDDRERGVSYVPGTILREAGVDLETVLADPSDPRGREVVAALVENVLPWLDAALEYTLVIPPVERDLRMFCALPLGLALRTLELAVRCDDAFRERALKISRSEVRSIHGRLERKLTDDGAIRQLYGRERARVAERIARARV